MPGMRVMQFGFEDGDSAHLPHNFDRHCIGYTATHCAEVIYPEHFIPLARPRKAAYPPLISRLDVVVYVVCGGPRHYRRRYA